MRWGGQIGLKVFKLPASCVSEKADWLNRQGKLQFSEVVSFLLFTHLQKTDSYYTTLTSMKCFSRCEWRHQRKNIPKNIPENIPCNTKRDRIEEWSRTTYLNLLSWATIYRCSLPILKCFHGPKTYYQGIFEWWITLGFLSQFVCIVFYRLWTSKFSNH